jgi:hypothetical protein
MRGNAANWLWVTSVHAYEATTLYKRFVIQNLPIHSRAWNERADETSRDREYQTPSQGEEGDGCQDSSGHKLRDEEQSARAAQIWNQHCERECRPRPKDAG